MLSNFFGALIVLTVLTFNQAAHAERIKTLRPKAYCTLLQSLKNDPRTRRALCKLADFTLGVVSKQFQAPFVRCSEHYGECLNDAARQLPVTCSPLNGARARQYRRSLSQCSLKRTALTRCVAGIREFNAGADKFFDCSRPMDQLAHLLQGGALAADARRAQASCAPLKKHCPIVAKDLVIEVNS
jgi:hypothetical protein